MPQPRAASRPHHSTAVDTAFMSTSKNERTPVDYMSGEYNVLWALHVSCAASSLARLASSLQCLPSCLLPPPPHFAPPAFRLSGACPALFAPQPSLQTDDAYHRGADISMLSQFANEEEVPFPPLTRGRLPAIPHQPLPLSSRPCRCSFRRAA